MQESTNREKVLKKIRSALLHKTPNPHPNLDLEKNIFAVNDAPPELVFAEKFQSDGGLLVICENKNEIIETLAAICKENNWNDIFCVDPTLSSLLDEVNFSHQSIYDPAEDKSVVTALLKADALLADSGKVVINMGREYGRFLPVFAQNIILTCSAGKIVDDLKSFFLSAKATYNGNQPSGFYFISPAANKITTPSGEELQSETFKKMYLLMVMDEES